MSDLDLILNILREEVQGQYNNKPSMVQPTVDGLSIDRVAPYKTKWEKDPNSESGKKILVRKREIAPSFRLKYKLTADGEVAPYTDEERKNRIKGTVNPDSDSKYAELSKEIGKLGGADGSSEPALTDSPINTTVAIKTNAVVITLFDIFCFLLPIFPYLL